MQRVPLGKTGLQVSTLGFGCGSVGVTAGTSTLDSTVDAVCAALAAIGAVSVPAQP